MSGGSAATARGNSNIVGIGTEAAATCSGTKIEIGATEPVQELRHSAVLVCPSGQQGQCVESSACGIESAQGISAMEPLPPAKAATTGADSNTCPDTSI